MADSPDNLEPQDPQNTEVVLALPEPHRHWWEMPAALGATLILLVAILIGGFNLVYAGKVLPGVRAHGIYLGGLTRSEAIQALEGQAAEYRGSAIAVVYNGGLIRINVDNLELRYDPAAAVDEALAYGRHKNLTSMLRQQVRTLLARPTNVAVYTYKQANLSPYFKPVYESVSSAVSNAVFNFEGASVGAVPATNGKRVDVGRLAMLVEERLAAGSTSEVVAPVYAQEPAVSDADLAEAKAEAATYLGGPIEIKAASQELVLNTDVIVGWLEVNKQVTRTYAEGGDIKHFYAMPARISLGVNEAKVGEYVAGIAAKVDQKGQDAALTIADGRATVFRPSRDGFELDRAGALKAIKEALTREPSERLITLEVKVTKPAVTEENINNLGIRELISEGVSYFPGSIPARIQNIRVGTARYQGVLLAPGEVFSFGEILGEVSAATGYAPARVIIGNKQEDQYGGGLCQVSSTVYRAALNAGLPILERYNHSFAVSYYTNPYGVPGVDATIYYPQVDFKFRNDTGSHILIQTVLSGTTLKFQFYGTKTKSGRIRGPYFVSGSLDHTKPSHTVFYRDILDLAGNVIKTDTVHTYYQSSEKFPAQPQYN